MKFLCIVGSSVRQHISDRINYFRGKISFKFYFPVIGAVGRTGGKKPVPGPKYPLRVALQTEEKNYRCQGQGGSLLPDIGVLGIVIQISLKTDGLKSFPEAWINIMRRLTI
mgnify:CR=1 FL=1